MSEGCHLVFKLSVLCIDSIKLSLQYVLFLRALAFDLLSHLTAAGQNDHSLYLPLTAVFLQHA